MKKQIFNATIVYTILSALQPLSNFILLPVYTRYFSESDYGTFSILNNFYILFNIIGGLGIAQAIMAFYSSYDDDLPGLNKYIGNVLTFNLYFNIILLFLAVLGGTFIFGIIFKEHIDFFPNGLLTVSYGLISNIVLGYLFFLKYRKNVSRFALFSIVQFILSTILQYVLIVHYKLGITGAFEARVLVSLFSLLIVILYHYRYMFIRLDFISTIKPSIKYSIKTIPASCIVWLISYGDRFLIEHFMNLKSLGIYSFLSTISALAETGFLAVGAALQPFIYDFFKVDDKRKANQLYKIFILLSVCVVSFIILLGSNLEWLVYNKGYLEIVPYLTLMAIGYIFSALTYLYTLQIIYAKKSGYFIYMGVIVLTSNILLNATLTPVFGIWGAVISSVTTKLIGAVTCYYFASKSYSLSFEKSNYSMLLFLTTLIIGFWLAGKLNYISYNIAGVLQFFVTIIFVAVEYRQLIRNSFKEILLNIRRS